ncbi:MAG: phosphoglucosamine mutase [Candidatus Omnitrophica bacterium 4484_70.2]|nr:MAG: phosphoglucosamine mutase [Candidatus Omnitrophica bacterium 4484_70.2]
MPPIFIITTTTIKTTKKMYREKERLFGTDGIRGTAGVYPLTDGMIFKIGYSIAHLLYYKYPAKDNLKVVIGKDTRLSSPKIEMILKEAISSSGIDVILCGIIPTPGLGYIVKRLEAQIGIMISASHNRSQDNGIKFFDEKGEKLSFQDEEWIEDIIFNNLVHTFYRWPSSKKGELIYFDDAVKLYLEFLQSISLNLNLEGLKICLDCGWGAVSLVAKELFKGLGAQVYSFADSFCGERINETGALNPYMLKRIVLEKRADIGFAFDGDGDRLIVIDNEGNILDGDYILAILADYLLKQGKLSKNTVVVTKMSNYGLKEFLEKRGIKVIFTSVGDRYVWRKLVDEDLNLGGEQSGHIILRDFVSSPDALVCALFITKIIKEKPLNELIQDMQKYPQVLVNVKVKEKIPFEYLPSLKEEIKKAEMLLKDKGRLLIRYSGTEPLVRIMVEGKDERFIQQIAQTLKEAVKKELG